MTRSNDLTGHAILVAEDEAMQALDLAAALREAGAEVIGPTPSGADALTLLRSRRCTAAILDFELRDGTVAAVARELDQSGIPFLLLTAFAADELPRGLRGYRRVSKPADRRWLIRAIGGFVRCYRSIEPAPRCV